MRSVRTRNFIVVGNCSLQTVGAMSTRGGAIWRLVPTGFIAATGTMDVGVSRAQVALNPKRGSRDGGGTARPDSSAAARAHGWSTGRREDLISALPCRRLSLGSRRTVRFLKELDIAHCNPLDPSSSPVSGFGIITQSLDTGVEIPNDILSGAVSIQ